MYHAYLLVFLAYSEKIPTMLPVVVGAGIFSSKDITMSFGRNHAVVFETSGDSYHSAQEKLLEVVQRVPMFQWLWPWLDPSEEAHIRRYHMEKELREQLGETHIDAATLK